MHMGRVKPRRRFFNISFSSFSRLFSCLKQPSSACISETGCVGARLTSAWPLRYSPATLHHLLERGIPKLKRVSPINSCFHTSSTKSKITDFVASIFRGPDHNLQIAQTGRIDAGHDSGTAAAQSDQLDTTRLRIGGRDPISRIAWGTSAT
jgi:hypothetical protein